MDISRVSKIIFFLFLLVQIPAVSFCQELVDILHGGTKGGVVGKLPGLYNVTPNGQFCYDIPLSVPSGIGGMVPKLSITYNSGNGNGLLGFGFDLKGLSTISRAPRNLYNDGISDVVRFNEDDRFALDGARLQLVKSSSTEREYRTEMNTFSKITAYGAVDSPKRFIVQTKDGITYEYESYSQLTKNLFWPLKKVTDTKGNYYTITYLSLGNNEVVPSSISYTGNKVMGVNPQNTIEFSYTSIGRSPSYISGEKCLRSKAIESITVKYGNNVVKQYLANYQNRNGKLFLNSVTEKAVSEQLNPTLFKWDNGESVDMSKRTVSDSKFQNVKVVTGDFNGDGKKDFITRANNNAKNYNFYVYLSNGEGFDSPVLFRYKIPDEGKYAVRIESLVAGDFNGDGYDDLVLERGDSPFYWLDYLESQVNNDGTVCFVNEKSICAPCKFAHTLHVMDANCDGAADLFVVNSNFYSNTYYALLSTTDNNTVSPLELTANGTLDKDSWDYPGCVSLVDLDGDGTFEVLNCKEQKSNGCGSVLYKMSKTGVLSQFTGLTLGGDDYFIVGDFNGDGKSDIITTGNKDKTKWEVNFSTGCGDAYHLFDSYNIATSYFSQKDKAAYAVDINGDGLCDIVAVDKENKSPIELYVNDGSGKSFKKITSSYSETIKNRVMVFEDFSGNGKVEMLSYPGWKNSEVGFAVYHADCATNLLSEITDGLNNSLEVSYERLTSKNSFTQGKMHTYPIISTANSWSVVSSLNLPNASYGKHMLSYQYENALYHKRGRGMLGFEEFSVTDKLTGESWKYHYGLNTKVMMPYCKSSEQYMKGILVSRTSYENYETSFQYNEKVPAEWVYTCMPCLVRELHYEYNSHHLVSSATTTSSYDKYGNVTQSLVDYGEKRVKTVNAYNNDETKWLLGRLARSVVTKNTTKEEVSTASEFTYDATSGLLTSEKFAPGKPYGYEKSYTYDTFGNITKSIKTPNDGSLAQTKITEYSKDGRFVSVVKDCLGFSTTKQVDSQLGVTLSETDMNGLSTNYAYDVFGNLQKVSDPLESRSVVMAWSKGHPYAPQGALYYEKSETLGKPTVWKFYDSLGQLLRLAKSSDIPSKVIFQDTQYDSMGRVAASSDPYFMGTGEEVWTRNTYDAMGRTLSVTTPLGAIIKNEYEGLVVKQTDPLGNCSTKIYDMLGQLKESCDALGNSVSYEYDINGNCTKVVGPRTTIESSYDEVGNRTKLVDPDLGIISCTYDSYGNLKTETTGAGTTTYTYDVAGRLLKEQRPDYTYEYVYDTKLKGMLSTKVCSNNTSIEYFYDKYGREVQRKENIKGKLFSNFTTFDAKFNRVRAERYPSGLEVTYGYAEDGSLSSISNVNSGKIYWKALSRNARGQVELDSLGNGLKVRNSFDLCGKIQGIFTKDVNDYSFKYDLNNNLVCKAEQVAGSEYSYDYDELNRLTHVYQGCDKRKLSQEIKYDEAGNICYKTGIGNISYKEGTNQLAEVRDNDHYMPLWNYIGYTSFDKVTHVMQNVVDRGNYNQLDLEYGPNKDRVYQEISVWKKTKNPGVESTVRKVLTLSQKYYVGSCFEKEVTKSGKTIDRAWLIADGKPVAFVENKDTSEYEYYLHVDNIGTIVACTDANGKAKSRMYCDPWGCKVDASTGNLNPVSMGYEVTDRCFTGHEHIDGFYMINMDGRVYSPYLGRFISPDPFVQAPDNGQSLNRYAYCLNNPLTLTDPTGYHWTGDLFCAMVGIAVGFETCGLGVGAAGALIGGACGGASSALASCLLNGANLWQTAKSTVVGGFWGAASGIMNCEIGDFTDDFWLSSALHSVSDGATEAMQGGHFEHGFFTGMVSSMGGQGIARYGDHLSLEVQVAASAVLGGTVSAIGGGKFASGAMTAAFQMMYNEQMHRGPYMSDLEKIDEIYRQTMADYPLPQGLYRELGLPEYNNGCAMRMSYALNKSGVLKIPNIKGQTLKGNDGNYYFMFAKDMDAWLSQRRVWGNPRLYKSPAKYKLMNGVVSQSGFKGTVTGHIEYFYNGHDGHKKDEQGASFYYYNSSEPFITKLWKHGR